MVAPKIEISDAMVRFAIAPSVVERTYQLQFSDTLAEASWQNLGGVVTGNGNDLSIATPHTPSITSRFFRLKLESIFVSLPNADRELIRRDTVNAPNTNGSAMSSVFDGTQGPGATVIGINNAPITTSPPTTVVGRYTIAVFSPNGDVTWKMKEDDTFVLFVRTSTSPSLIANGLRCTDRYAVLVKDGDEYVMWTYTMIITVRPTVVVP